MNGLIYRESWKETPPARPVTQDHVSDPDLLLLLYGPGKLGLKKSHHDDIEGDPYYLWSGKCDGNWAVALRHKKFFINFAENGRVRWCIKQSGACRLRLILKPAEGPWLVSEETVAASDSWRETEFRPVSLTWQLLDIDQVRVIGNVPALSLARIDAVGFTDLSPGGGSESCSRLAWMEVWGEAVDRLSVSEA